MIKEAEQRSVWSGASSVARMPHTNFVVKG